MPTTTSNICSKCNIRALWILNNVDFVVFSRRFPTVERRWRAACKSDDEKVVDGSSDKPTVSTSLPNDSEFSEAFTNRRKREGSARGSGIRVAESVQGSDSWVDDPIVRHIISLHIDHEEGEGYMLWPLVFHVKGPYCILVLPLVEPKHVKAYEGLCKRSDCGTAIGMDPNLSSLLFDLPSITGAFMLAHVIGDIITGDFAEPEIAVSASPSVGGLLDSLTGSIGISSISARGKPVPASVPNSTASPASLAGSVLSDAQKAGSRPLEKDALQSFISSSMPFGTLLDLSYSNLSAIRLNGFSATDVPPADVKQPAWKPYLYRGKQRILFTIYETINASMYDRDEIPDSISISGQVNCRAELEGLPDVSFPLTGLINSRVEVLSFHPCVQVPEHGIDKQSLVFSPPFGNFTLMRYLTFCNLGPPVKGFYQLSMVSENEGAFLFKLRLMDGYKAPLAMEFCTITMPFPRRKVVSFSGTPSIGTLAPSKVGVGIPVAVKKCNADSAQGLKEWKTEVNFLGKFSHPNLVKLIGYCWEDKELLLVYEHLNKGSLENHLFQNKVEPPSWTTRINIALDAARGLDFLHTSENTVIYRDFKAANILLDENFGAKLSDFGLARIGPPVDKSHVTTQAVGTFGYAAPEYINTGHLYVRSDVYGFGVVLLEILTGFRAYDLNRPTGQTSLVDWYKPMLSEKSKVKKIIDPRMDDYPPEGANKLAQLILRCLQNDPKNRPPMSEVVIILERISTIRMNPKGSKPGSSKTKRPHSYHPSPAQRQNGLGGGSSPRPRPVTK